MKTKIIIHDIRPSDLLILTDWVKDEGLDTFEPPYVRLTGMMPRKYQEILEQWLPNFWAMAVDYSRRPRPHRIRVKVFSRTAVYSLLKKAGVSAPSRYYSQLGKNTQILYPKE